MFHTMDNQEFDACGSHLQGRLTGYSYEQLVRSFGEPTFSGPSEDGKTTVEWHIEFEMEDEAVKIYGCSKFVKATIYDYKSDVDASENTRWSIGGWENMAESCVSSVIYLDHHWINTGKTVTRRV